MRGRGPSVVPAKAGILAVVPAKAGTLAVVPAKAGILAVVPAKVGTQEAVDYGARRNDEVAEQCCRCGS